MLEPMLDWSDLQHFLALATTDSLPKAAERLGVNRTTVSRRITDLEGRSAPRCSSAADAIWC